MSDELRKNYSSLAIHLQSALQTSKAAEQDVINFARKTAIIFDGIEAWMSECPCMCSGCEKLLEAIRKAGEIV